MYAEQRNWQWQEEHNLLMIGPPGSGKDNDRKVYSGDPASADRGEAWRLQRYTV